MKTITVGNVNAALPAGLVLLGVEGRTGNSRNGRVRRLHCPVTTVYTRPTERVLFHPVRDANPFFHLMEALWMLTGRHDIAFPATYNSRFTEFSDDGENQWGAYGWRWREFFGFDQIRHIIEVLQENKDDRRAVLQMWTPNGDLVAEHITGRGAGKDVPCNTAVYFRADCGTLDMTVTNRSNDIVWGAYGANAVHFSILQEVVAGALGMPVGTYWQVSNNFHAYVDRPDVQRLLEYMASDGAQDGLINDRYDTRYGGASVHPLFHKRDAGVHGYDKFIREVVTFCAAPADYHAGNSFLASVAAPMARAWVDYKKGRIDEALECLLGCDHSTDWIIAAKDWLLRRLEKRNA